ncbi:hypothetical protein Z949_1818 [Sulfitobacter guttiformis KCTC 32187]|nr:hypothetical protein Z949_1818 [Sulfitobacter guttiformis KCTC 32187]
MFDGKLKRLQLASQTFSILISEIVASGGWFDCAVCQGS